MAERVVIRINLNGEDPGAGVLPSDLTEFIQRATVALEERGVGQNYRETIVHSQYFCEFHGNSADVIADTILDASEGYEFPPGSMLTKYYQEDEFLPPTERGGPRVRHRRYD